jgi:hypothetical protein
MSERRRLMMGFIDNGIYINGYEVVDLGLPSGKLWASCNIGAENPWNFGLYFSYGNVDGHEFGTYNFSNYYSSSMGKNAPTAITSTQYDAATVNMGSPFHIPTNNDYDELVNNTTHEFFVYNGTKGMKFMKKGNNSVFIFLPYGGYYNNSSQYSAQNATTMFYSTSNAKDSTYASLFRIYLENNNWVIQNRFGWGNRYTGLTIRPVSYRI